jgi:hypothetical protein
MKRHRGVWPLALLAVLITGACDTSLTPPDRSASPARPAMTATLDVSDAPVFRNNQFYDIVDETGNTIWQDIAGAPLAQASFRLFVERALFSGGPTTFQECQLQQTTTLRVPSCPAPFVTVASGDRTCVADGPYPFAASFGVLADGRRQFFPECVATEKDPSQGGLRFRMVAAPTAPGGLVFKRWEVRFSDVAWSGGALVPCAEGDGSLTCTIDNRVGAASLLLVYGAPSAGFAFSGFLAPVVGPPLVNIARAGRAIPVKFSLSGDRGLDILVAGSPSVRQVACDLGQNGSDVEATETAGDSRLSYDAARDEYTYVWSTDRAWAGTCRDLALSFTDGSAHTAQFRFSR